MFNPVKIAAHNQGFNVRTLFTAVSKKTDGRPQSDFLVTRFAAYLVAMNGDPRKAEVSAAQHYFAVKTRQAELSAPTLPPMSDDELMEADGTYSWAAVANILGWGRNVMLRELRRLGVIQGNRLPDQRYAHHFKVVPGTYKHPKSGEQVPYATTTVRPSGVDFLRKKLAVAQLPEAAS
ncbi:phage antirepressor KilAC domain-containing protein [Mycobacterium palustre]|uniref:phage antirepressor KilAC domain-containing protein n=1 Tax=Mycobacterium palustre TaxID=153971 RepID=UPI0021F2E897|nr:phage antirepressor KilAC domain-containing protein [Mycobacterium palustre]MCV7102527.1 phage antirepressor KilAC domain-containing protein [Mycobacterium palustre]